MVYELEALLRACGRVDDEASQVIPFDWLPSHPH